MQERWRRVPSWERYEASTLGRVRVVAPDASNRNRYLLHVLAPGCSRGYAHVTLYQNGKRKIWLVHRLILHTFVDPDPARRCVNHKNGVKTDNRLSNLEYSSPAENYRHALRELKHQPAFGERHWNARLPDSAIPQIKQRIADGATHQVIAKEFGTSIGTVSRIRNGKSRHVVPKT